MPSTLSSHHAKFSQRVRALIRRHSSVTKCSKNTSFSNDSLPEFSLIVTSVKIRHVLPYRADVQSKCSVTLLFILSVIPNKRQVVLASKRLVCGYGLTGFAKDRDAPVARPVFPYQSSADTGFQINVLMDSTRNRVIHT